MAKKARAKKTTETKPLFIPGTSVDRRSMVIDQNGAAWWVDPDSRTIAEVTVPGLGRDPSLIQFEKN